MRAALAAALLLAAGAPAAAQAPFQADATRLRPGVLSYDVVVTGDSSVMSVGTHRVEMQETSFAGRTAWRVIDHRESFEPFVRITASDTVLLGRDTLDPLRWDARTGDARFVAAFTSDSVYGGATSPLARRTFTLPAPDVVLTSEGALDALLQAVAFHPGWSTDAVMLVADLGGGRLVPVRLSLAYETSLTIPAGTFDVWVVHASSAGTDRWFWVDKGSGVVVRTETLSPHMPGMLVERILSQPPGR